MSVEVVMPQMGESITEGTVSRWLKKVGDKVAKDEPVLEISTDKVDAEVPSPGEGILLEIRVQEGDTVAVGTVVAVIGAEGAVVAPQASNIPVESVEKNDPAPASVPVSSSVSTDEAADEVVMPQMGESITEGTVSRWLKSVGDKVQKDEPLLEISTDKVDAEVPSPSSGILLEIKVQEGETVAVGSVVALVGAAGAAAKSSPSPRADQPKVESESNAAEVSVPPTSVPMPVPVANGHSTSVDDLRRTKSSPLVRNIARQHGIDLGRIPGSGVSGRVTKKDILHFIETGAALRPQDLLGARIPSARPAAGAVSMSGQTTKIVTAVGDRVEPMSVMRKKIAEHMVHSKHTSAHVASVYEIDMTRISRFRDANKDAFQAKYGTKLTFMPFIFEGVTQALRQFPIVNSQVDGDNIVYKGDVNLGMAVALDWGLIVPVIKKADTLTLAGLAKTANDLADRARSKKLSPDDVQGGTFTITNPGVFGGLYGTPIINQPQVAILCVGTIEKRPRVITTSDGEDVIAIRQMAYFAMTYDHRVVDGADAEKFLSYLKHYLENTDFVL
jgi:2-oxoglutarate dehydrogenase E2 component (dihydrolipoamide succinyltransferase)